MTIIQVLEELEQAAQGNVRLEVLKKHDSKQLRELLFLTLSPDVTFGVKKIPVPVPSDYTFKDEEWHSKLLALLESFKVRSLVGKEAQSVIANFLGQCNDTQKKWAERIIRQDLRLNIGAKDVNNVLGANTIYLFSVPLATDFVKVKQKDLKGNWVCQAKLDGGRCVAFLPANKGLVSLKSRTGKEWYNFESIKKSLQHINNTRLNSYKSIVFDGEVVSLDDEGKVDFQSIQKTMMRKDKVEVGKLKYIIFDYATEEEWKNPQKTYIIRHDNLEGFFCLVASPTPDNIGLVYTLPDCLENPTHEGLVFVAKQLVEQGYEGLIVRRADEVVKNKRSKQLLKVKLWIDEEAEIIGKSELQREGKGVGTLGALICRVNGKEFEVGSGFKDHEREELWNDKSIFGQKVAFRYFELTDDGKPRFPTFRGIRHPDDIGKEDSDVDK